MASARAARRIIEAVIASEAKIPYRRGRKALIASSQELLAMTRRQRRLLTLSLRPRRSPTAARGGVSSLRVVASRAKQSISSHERKDGLLRRFAPRNDGVSCWQVPLHVIASEAKQSILRKQSWIASSQELLAMTEYRVGRWAPSTSLRA